jgi:hypothetical protein
MTDGFFFALDIFLKVKFFATNTFHISYVKSTKVRKYSVCHARLPPPLIEICASSAAENLRAGELKFSLPCLKF